MQIRYLIETEEATSYKIYTCEEKPELHMHMYFHILFLELYLVFGARATRYF